MSERAFQERKPGVLVVEFRHNHPAIHAACALSSSYDIAVKPSPHNVLMSHIAIGSDEAGDVFQDVMQTHELHVLDQLMRIGEMPDLGVFSPDLQKQLTAVRLRYVQQLYVRQTNILTHLEQKAPESFTLRRHMKQYERAIRKGDYEIRQTLGDLPELDVPAFVGGVVQRVVAERQQQVDVEEQAS